MSNTNLEPKITIDEDKCIVCGLCAQLYPEIFELKGDKINVQATNLTNINEMIASCPQGAISIKNDN